MERPLCPLCKTKHFAREAHEWKNVAVRGDGGMRVSEVSGEVSKPGLPKPMSQQGSKEKGKVGRPRLERTVEELLVRRKEYMRSYRERKKKAGTA